MYLYWCCVILVTTINIYFCNSRRIRFDGQIESSINGYQSKSLCILFSVYLYVVIYCLSYSLFVEYQRYYRITEGKWYFEYSQRQDIYFSSVVRTRGMYIQSTIKCHRYISLYQIYISVFGMRPISWLLTWQKGILKVFKAVYRFKTRFALQVKGRQS